MSQQFWNLIACPVCGTSGSIKNSHSICCQICNTKFFSLGDIPCLFPSGIHQRDLWNHLLAALIEQGDQSAKALNVELLKPGLSHLTYERLKNALHRHNLTQMAIHDVLQTSGLQAVKNVKYEQYSMKPFLDYYHLMLRDWGWHSSDAWQNENLECDENRIALNNILHLMKPVFSDGYQPKRILFIGAGAARLSWDFHCSLKPDITVALDLNPLLLSVGSRLIKNNDVLFGYETNRENGSSGFDFKQWQLSCPKEEQHLHDTWFPLLADAIAMPFVAQSFDLVITPWVIDVIKHDCKDLIANVEKFLAPGGHWLNYGPFLYSNDFTESCKYSSFEIKEFLQLSRFSIVTEEFFVVPYSCSPLTNSGRIERVWGALAKSSSCREHLNDGGTHTGVIDRNCLPAWIIMPHLPIPRFTTDGLFPAELENIVQLIDGKNSINDLKSYITPYLPEGYQAKDVIYKLLFDLVINAEKPTIVTTEEPILF